MEYIFYELDKTEVQLLFCLISIQAYDFQNIE